MYFMNKIEILNKNIRNILTQNVQYENNTFWPAKTSTGQRRENSDN